MKKTTLKDTLLFALLIPIYFLITIPIMFTILILNSPIFKKTKRAPLAVGVICEIYEPITFSEKAIFNLKKLLI